MGCLLFLPKAIGANIAPSTNMLLGWPFPLDRVRHLDSDTVSPHVSISGSGPAPGKGGKAAGAENEQF